MIQDSIKPETHEQDMSELNLNTSGLIAQLTKEYESLTQIEKNDEAEAESLLRLLYEKWAKNAQNPSDPKEMLEHFEQELNKLFISIFAKLVTESGDGGNFVAIDQAQSMITSDPQFAYARDPSRAMYLSKENLIYVPKERLALFSDFGFLITELMTKGFAASANIVHHEYIHSLQHGKESIVRNMLMGFGIGINRDLKEVQAMIGSDRKGRGKSIDSEYVIQYLQSNYPNGMGTEAAQIRISTSWKLIYELYALGLSDSEIGDMVRRSSWDRKHQTFGLLSSKVGELCQERNITKQELADLVIADQLRTKIRIEKTRIIAKHYIENALEDSI